METKETQENSEGSAGLAAATGSAVVQVSVNGGPYENASKLVWWLARMALKQMGRQERPKVGDTVVEVTHLLGLARHQLGLVSAVGELIEIEGDQEWPTAYKIRTLEGKVQRWENAQMVTIDRLNNADQRRGE